MRTNVIETIGLSRTFRIPAKGQSVWRRLLAPTYEDLNAVADVNLTVREGEIMGYIGPNGAGKSTTIKMLLGVLHPTAGQVRVLGRDPYRERLANNQDIGVVWGQRNYLQFDVPVEDSLERFRRVYRVSKADFDARMKVCEEFLEVGPLLHKHARQLSLGQRMRCNLANVMLHGPKVLYLDEPTIGLDVVVKLQVRRFLRLVNREWGTTILLTTHDMGDIEDLCPRIVVIDKGKVLIDDTLAAVRERLGGGARITFTFAPDCVLAPDLPQTLAAAFPGITANVEPGPRLVTQVPPAAATPIQVVRWVVQQLEPMNLTVQENPIEEVVKRIYAGGEHLGA